jgi:hypothetical protein
VSTARFSNSLAATDYRSTTREEGDSLADDSANSNKKEVAALLDDRFQWVKSSRRIQLMAQIVADLAQFAADNESA